MIQFDKKEHDDAAWLNRAIKECLGVTPLTQDQEAAVKRLIIAIAAGYQRTLDRQSWGPGWD
jgi:hypothetical protein